MTKPHSSPGDYRGPHYRVYVFDRSLPEDRLVAARYMRAAAAALVRRLNAESVAAHGVRGPLFYLERVEPGKYTSLRVREFECNPVGNDDREGAANEQG